MGVWGPLTSPKPPFPSTRYCLKVVLVTGCLEKKQELTVVPWGEASEPDTDSTCVLGSIPGHPEQPQGTIAAENISEGFLWGSASKAQAPWARQSSPHFLRG